jgi:hypothetical protein
LARSRGALFEVSLAEHLRQRLDDAPVDCVRAQRRSSSSAASAGRARQ